MNTSDDLDLMLIDWLDAQSPKREPEGLLDRVMAVTATTRRRPGWRVVNQRVALALAGPTMVRRVAPIRRTGSLVLVAILLLLALVAGLVAIGSYRRLPPPFGLARPGLITFDAAETAGSTSRIWVADPNGPTRRPLTPAGLHAVDPRFSPNGTTVAFWGATSVDGPWNLMVVDVDGDDLRTVAGPWTAVGSIAWAPDSVHIAVDVTVGFESRVMVARSDASGATATGDPTLLASDPVWSPDGSRIAFRGDRLGGGFGHIGLYVMTSGGGDVRRLSSVAATTDYDFVAPVWSPDGSRIAVVVGDDTSYNLWVTPLDGSASVEVAHDPADEVAPMWSPDGSRIAFLRGLATGTTLDQHHRPDLRNEGFNVVIADPDGSNPVVLPGPAVDDHPIAWSPDGSHVLGYVPRVANVFDNDDDRLVILGPGDETPQVVALDGINGDGGDWQRLAR